MSNNWQYLFAPSSVAVVGASSATDSWGCGIMKHLLASARRNIYPVSPTAQEVLGVKAYKSVLDIPSSVDLAVIVIRASQIPAVLKECVQKGITAAVIISGGFAETGEQGAKLQAEIVQIARQGGIRFVGPNSLGHIDTSSQLSTLAWTGEITPGPVALISQSGNFGHQIIRNGVVTGFGFSKFVSTGNQADLGIEDYLEYLAQDENTTIIAAYIEGLREGRRFFELAKKITVSKPMIVIKSGSTKASARAAISHSAALAGSEVVYAAAFKQAGVIRVDDADELCDVVSALLNQPLPRSNRVGILTMWGGLGVVAAEACEKAGLEIPALESSTVEKLDACLPSRWSRGNPVDMAGILMTDIPVILSSLWALMEDANIDAIMLQAPLPLGTDRISQIFCNCNAQEIGALKEAEIGNIRVIKERVNQCLKPVYMVRRSFELATDPNIFSILRKEGFPTYPSPQRAARVLRHLAWYRRYLDAAGIKRTSGIDKTIGIA